MIVPEASPSPSLADLEREMNKIGCPELIALDGPPSAAHLNYLDLMSGRRASDLWPTAVAEFQGRPILYLVNDLAGSVQPTETQVRHLGQVLANRSEHAVLGVVRPGELTLYPINLSRAELDSAAPKPISLTSFRPPCSFKAWRPA